MKICKIICRYISNERIKCSNIYNWKWERKYKICNFVNLNYTFKHSYCDIIIIIINVFFIKYVQWYISVIHCLKSSKYIVIKLFVFYEFANHYILKIVGLLNIHNVLSGNCKI